MRSRDAGRWVPVPLRTCLPPLLVLLLLLAAPVPGAGQTGREEVVSLDFTGNRVIPSSDLSSAIVTRETGCLSAALLPFCWLGAGFAEDRYFRSPRAFQEDLARIALYYYIRGYRQADVDRVVEPVGPDQVEVEFLIEEGPPTVIDSVEVFGLEEVEPELATRIGSVFQRWRGQPLDLAAIDLVRDDVQALLRESGYAHADVLRGYFAPQGTLDARLTVDVYPGPLARFGAITVEGNEELDETVIRRMLPFREGTRYRQELIFQGQRNLFSLELLRLADLTQDLENQPDSLVPVTVRVAEGNTHRVRTGLGWTSAECLTAEARWSSRNFLGGARRLQLQGRAANLLAENLRSVLCTQAGTEEYGELNWLVGADFTQPFLFSSRNSLSAGVYAERQSLQDVFVRRALGLNVLVNRSIGRGSFLTASFRPQVGQLDAAEVFFCTSYAVCEPTDIEALQGTNTLSPVGIGVTQDLVNQLLNPTAGRRLLLDIEHASAATGSDYGYDRVIGEMVGYWGVGSTVVAGRIRGGWLNPRPFRGSLGAGAAREIAHPQKRFYAGGANSVRGFAQNQLGPRVLTVDVLRLLNPRTTEEGETLPPVCTPLAVFSLRCDASELADGAFDPRATGGTRVVDGGVEVRFPVVRDFLQGAAFVDFGQVFSENSELDLDRLEVTPGLGLRYLSPIGPLRVDVAYRPVGAEDLRVITSRIRPRTLEDSGDGETILDGEWEVLNELAFLRPPVAFGSSAPFSWSRFQVHLSIGQAF